MQTLIKDYAPPPALNGFVRKYQLIRWSFATHEAPPPKLLQPRPEHSIAFYIRDKQSFWHLNSDQSIIYPKVILSGVHTQTIYRDCGHDFLALKVVLQPCALYRLTGIPAPELTSSFIDAEAIWGKSIRSVFEQIANTDNIAEVLVIVEQFMHTLIRQSCRPQHPIDQASRLMLTSHPSSSLDWLARQSGISVRQFIRKFEERTGVSPKLFDRIARFDRVYRLKNSYPTLDWLSIALAGGYYDYQHLAKDYRDFTGTTPVNFYELDQQAPERQFGLFFG
ncbi:MAG: AraC family transcriptional regulator [Cytophagales bacterium]|nr:MAG: AraC family transcriptional regulator [Cytophagales bacterium]